MLTWTSVVVEQTDTEIAAAVARREQLQIRPLIEHPALRHAMGLDAAEAAAAPAADAGRERPSTTSSSRSRKGASRRTAPRTGAPAKIAA